MSGTPGTVGQTGHNYPDDVRLVQQLLNKHMGSLIPLAPLNPDGVIGRNTISAIEEFQRRVVRLTNPDGRVDPGGATITSLFSGPGAPRLGTLGTVVMAPNANRSGVAMSQLILDFMARVAGTFGNTIRVTCGTNHNQYTTTGNVSDHWAGDGADVGVPVDSLTGDAVAMAALMVTGMPFNQALRRAHQGGAHQRQYNGHRVQIIWRTTIGGNHHNHVHIGVSPTVNPGP